MKTPKLKPCPFCGGEAQLLTKYDSEGRKLVRARCSVCYAQSPYKASPELHGWFRWIEQYAAAAAWNGRAES